MTRNISPVDISAPFFEVARIYRRHRRLLYVGNDATKALYKFHEVAATPTSSPTACAS